MKSLIVLLGPTGVGKTELSLALAERLGSPIISADSRQIYKRIKIGTAAPSDEQLARVKHYFVHSLELGEYYSAAEYEKDVLDLLDGLFKEYYNVVLTGGSMMYIDAVTKGIDDIPTIDDDTRQMLKHRLEVDGLDVLLEELRILDPEYYKIVDKKNHKRVVHALEICYMTGKAFTSFRTNQVKQRPFRIVKFGLRRERTDLFDRINKRVEQMMADGLLEEARSVYGLRDLNSLNTVGYKEMFRVLSGEWELPMAVERMKKNTRVYAKKQMTWFNHDNNIQWLDADKLTTDEMLNKIMQDIR